MKKDALISDCGKYRYWLSRIWDDSKPLIMFIGLNPSTADANDDDPTIRRLISFATHWGFGGFYITNLFAFRSKDPTDLHIASDPIGGELCNHWILVKGAECSRVIVCWGINGRLMNRHNIVGAMYPDALCFGQTMNGYPKHPLYLSSETPLSKFVLNND